MLSGLGAGDEEQDGAEDRGSAKADGSREELVVSTTTDALEFQGLDVGVEFFMVKGIEAALSLAPLAGGRHIREVAHLEFDGGLHFSQNRSLLCIGVQGFIPVGLFKLAAFAAEHEDGTYGGQAEDEAADGQAGEVLAVDHRIHSEWITLSGTHH